MRFVLRSTASFIRITGRIREGRCAGQKVAKSEMRVWVDAVHSRVYAFEVFEYRAG